LSESDVFYGAVSPRDESGDPDLDRLCAFFDRLGDSRAKSRTVAAGSRSHVGVGLLRAGAVRCPRSARRRQVGAASTGRRIPDESPLPTHEHRAGAILSRRETMAIAFVGARYQRQQLHRALSSITAA